jgi:hypothetical protein
MYDARAARSRAERLITLIRDRAFAELERERGELRPMALTIDDAGRIGLVDVYDGHDYPTPDRQLVDLRATLRRHAERQPLAGAATAHSERIRMPGEGERFEAVCVQYEAPSSKPLRVYFPYTIRKRLSGPSEITQHEPITMDGTHAIFRREEPG